MVIRLSTLIAVFTLGFLLGASLLNLISGVHLDKAELEIQKLHTQLSDQSEQIKALEDSLAQRRKLTVSKIEIHMIRKDDKQENEYDNLEIEKSLKELLRDVRGQEVASLDPLLITNIIHKRTIEISERKFLIEVKATLISEKLIMYVEVTESQQPFKP